MTLHICVCHDEPSIPWTSSIPQMLDRHHATYRHSSPISTPSTQNSIMSPSVKAIVMRLPRLDLSRNELFQLSVYSIYVSCSANVVASLMNRKWTPTPRLTPKDVKTTYLHLHDIQHDAWVRAKDMNRIEKELLQTILRDCGVEEELWNVDIIRPAGPTAGLRLESPTTPHHSSGDGEV